MTGLRCALMVAAVVVGGMVAMQGLIWWLS